MLLLASTTAAVLAEVALRLFCPDSNPRTAAISRLWRHDPDLGWSHVPGAHASFPLFGRTIHVAINSTGFRDKERSVARDPKRFRIATCGDSMVWGYGVAQDETFTSILESRHPELEVINFGVSGYGTDQELIQLERVDLAYHPDLVILVFVRNDFYTNVATSAYFIYEKPMFVLDDRGGLQIENVPVPEQGLWKRVASAMVRKSYLLNYVASAYSGAAEGQGSASSSPDRSVGPRAFPSSNAERVSAAEILQFDRDVRQADAKFLLLIGDGMGDQARAMSRYFQAANIATMNLDELIPPASRAATRIPDGAHWNAEGHKLVAQAIYERLARGFLPSFPR